VKFDDFERDAFKAFRRKAIGSGRLTAQDLEITDETLLQNLRLAEGDYLKRAALLVFHQDPENWAPGAFFRSGQIEAWGRGIEKNFWLMQVLGETGPFF
jgi:ATP-dependent DNA helicase RecG